MLESLDKRERNILRLRYGITTHMSSMTFGEIGTMHGLTKERIRQIEHRALSKLRNRVGKTDLESVLYDYKLRTPSQFLEDDEAV